MPLKIITKKANFDCTVYTHITTSNTYICVKTLTYAYPLLYRCHEYEMIMLIHARELRELQTYTTYSHAYMYVCISALEKVHTYACIHTHDIYCIYIYIRTHTKRAYIQILYIDTYTFAYDGHRVHVCEAFHRYRHMHVYMYAYAYTCM